VQIPHELVEHIRRFVETFRNRAGPGDPLLLSERGEQRLHPTSVYQRIRDLGRAAKLKFHLSPQTLRHTYALNLYRETKNLSLVQERLGHMNVRTTAIYVRTLAKIASDQINPMDRVTVEG
jgi:integrase/recombinase XerD